MFITVVQRIWQCSVIFSVPRTAALTASAYHKRISPRRANVPGLRGSAPWPCPLALSFHWYDFFRAISVENVGLDPSCILGASPSNSGQHRAVPPTRTVQRLAK